MKSVDLNSRQMDPDDAGHTPGALLPTIAALLHQDKALERQSLSIKDHQNGAPTLATIFSPQQPQTGNHKDDPGYDLVYMSLEKQTCYNRPIG